MCVHCTIDALSCRRGCTLILMSSSIPTSRCCRVCRTKVGVMLQYVSVGSWNTADMSGNLTRLNQAVLHAENQHM